MNANEFVNELRRLTPTSDQLIKLEKSERTIERWKKCFLCKPRNKVLKYNGKSNSLIDLITQWDCTNLKIGMISFLERPVDKHHSVEFGAVEADSLVLNVDNSISVIEYGTDNHNLWDVSIDSDHFLDALSIVAARLNGIVLDKVDPDNDSLSKEIAKECAIKAGGLKYKKFYLMLFGC